MDKLKRNYLKNPLKKGEKPFYEDLLFLYIDKNISLQQLVEFFNVSQTTITKWLKFYKIKKPKNLMRINLENTCLKKYGTKIASKSEKVKEKAKQTCQEKYGTNSYCQTEKFKQQSKETCLQKYGVEYGSQTREFQEKVKQTSLEKIWL